MEEIQNDTVEYSGPQQSGPTIGGLFGRLAAFTIAAGATTALLRSGSKMAAKYLTSKIPTLKNIGKTEVTGSLEGIASHFLGKTVPSIGQSSLAADLRTGNRAYLKWAAGWNKQERAFNQVKYLEEGARYASENVAKATDFHFSRMRAQTADFFTRPGLGVRATGLAFQMSKKALAGNAGAYVADQALNIFNEPGERQGPAWYNPIGHALNFAKFTAQTLPFGLMFSGGLGYAAKMGTEAGIGGLKYLTQSVIGRETTQRAVARTAAGADWIFKGLSGLHTAMSQSVVRAQSVIPQDIMSFQFAKKAVNPTAWLDFAKEGITGFKKGWGLHKAAQSTDFQFDAEIRNMISRAAQTTEPQGRETFLRDFYTRTQKNRSSAMEYMFGLERKVDFGSELAKTADQALAQLKLPGKTNEQKAAIDAFSRGWTDTSHLLSKMGVQVQSGIYKGVGNNIIDIRPIHPRYLMNKVADVMDLASFRLAGNRVNVFQMFMIPNLIRKTQYEEWTNGAVFLGTNRTAAQRTGRSRVLSSNNPEAEALIENGWYAPRGGIGVFAGGGFSHYQDGSIRRLHTPRMTYKTFAKGQWGLMADTMAWLGGRYPQPLQETDTGGRSFGKRVMEALDIDMTNKEGVFRRIGSHVRKYVWSPGNPHPNFIYENMANFERGGDLASGQGFVRGIKHLVDDAVGVFSGVRTKRFTDAILSGSATNPNNLDDFRYVADRARESLSESNLHPYVRDLASSWNIQKITDRAKMTDDYNSIRRLMMEPAAGGRKNYDQMIDFLTIDALSKKDTAGEVITYTNDLVNSLQRKGEIGELGAASLKVISYGLTKQQQSTFFKNYLSQRGGTIRGENLQELTKFLKTASVERDIKTVAKHIYKNPLSNFIDLDDVPYKSGMISNESKIQNLREAPFVAIPWTSSGRMLSKELAAIGISEANADPRPQRAQGDVLTGKGIAWAATVRRMSNILTPFDLGLNPAKYQGGGVWNKIGGPGTQMFIEGMALKRAGAIAGLATAYGIADRLVDVMPGLQNTPLGEGLTIFGADQFVKARMGVSWVADALGITSTAKYMEGLFPGSIDSPLMRAARGVVAPLWLANAIGHSGGSTGKRMQWGLLGGMAMGAMQGFGMFDMTKNTAELKEIYSGREEIPIKRGRWWELGSSNYSGSRIRGWYPNWYARLKSQYMSTPEGWGSPLEQIMYKPWPLFDFNPLSFLMGEPHHYAYQHYYSRPYPETGSAFYEFPFVGPALSSTLGRIMAPPKQMHKQELYAQLDKYGYSTAGGFTQRVGSIPGTSEMARSMPVSNFGIRQTIGNQLYNLEQVAGLWGFGLQTVTQELGGFEQPYQDDNVLENAGEITSMRREYYDKELGGLAGMSEAWRRFLPKRQAQINRINPLQNRMPKWLPVQFRTGDAYAKTPWGELILPGQGYCVTPDTNIQCVDGWKKAESVNISDLVLTTNGFQPVEKIYSRIIDEDIYEITTYNGNVVKITENHDILCYRTLPCKYHKTQDYITRRPCKPNTLTKFCNKVKCNDNKNYKEEWVKAKDLREGDYVIFPKPKIEWGKIQNLDSNHILTEAKSTCIRVAKDTYRYIRETKYDKRYTGKPLFFPDNIELTPEFMYFIGIYLAEGSIRKSRKKGSYNSIQLVMSIDEEHILRSISEYLEKTFHIHTMIHFVDNTVLLEVYSTPLTTIINYVFGSVLEKRIPLGISNPLHLICGLYDGDGNKEKEKVCLTSSNKYKYTKQLPIILSSLSIGFSQCKQERDNQIIYITRVQNKDLPYLKLKYIDNYTENKSRTNIVCDDKILYKVRKIITKKYRGNVHDFQIKDVHNYTTGFVVHNSSAHDVEMTYPATADMLGLPLEETVRRMTSLGRPEPIGREELEKVNARIKAAAEVYEPYNDVSGTYDGIIRKGRRAILQKIKNFNSQELTDVVGPTETDISEVNFYMRMAGVSEGIIQYRVDGVPSLAYPVQYNEQRFQKDMEILSRARRKAADLYAKGVGFEGMGYSHLDRANILATVAPYSNEFKAELSMAKQSVKVGKGDVNKLEKIKKHAAAMKMSQEFYPRRFLGRVMSPEATYNNMSLNEYMKAAAEYSLPERMAGALWEGFNSLNHPFDKFHSYKTPLEAYKADTLYGRRVKMWQNPNEHWLDAMERGFMSKTDPMSGYLAGFLGGYTFGPGNGSASTFLMSGLGAAYGAVHGMYRKVTGSTYIPGTIQETRNVNRYFDQMNYQKDMLLYEMTGDSDYLEGARSTMMGLNPSDLSRQSWSRFYRATPYQEKPYVMAFLKETDQDERKKILSFVPSDVGDVLASKWAKMDGISSDREMTKRSLAKMPPPEWAGWSPEVNLDDVELKTVQQLGFEAHDFGLGWYEQQRRIKNSPGLPGPINMKDPTNIGSMGDRPMFNQSEIRRSLERALEGMGVRAFISVSPSYSDNILTVIG